MESVLEISDFKPTVYSMIINNIDISKTVNKKSKHSFLDLEKLVKNFKLDKSFISKSYYQSDPVLGYNDPPIGPIPVGFMCLYCYQEGPDNHLISCTDPFDDLLVLSSAGTKVYPKYEESSSHMTIVKKRGQSKVRSTSVKARKFTDNVTLIYTSDKQQKCTIRIAKNGSINIISAQSDNTDLPNKIVKKINETGSLTQEYPYPKFKIENELTYKYLIRGQFNLYPVDNKKEYYINLGVLDTYLKKYIGEVFDNYIVSEYSYNSGDTKSKSGNRTPPLTKFMLTNKKMIDITVLISNRGTVQLIGSYNKNPDGQLQDGDLTDVYELLKDLFNEIIRENKEIIGQTPVSLPAFSINNMRDGGQPKNCRPENRPFPYSFYGKCKTKGQYIRPEGVKRSDGTYEPCCYNIKAHGKDSRDNYKNTLEKGYSVPEITESAVFTPGTKTIESRVFKGLLSFKREDLIECIQRLGYI